MHKTKDKTINNLMEVDKISIPLFDLYYLRKEEFRKGVTDFDVFIFLMEGRGRIRYDLYPEMEIPHWHFIFVPYGSSFEIHICENTTLIMIRMYLFNQISEIKNLRQLYEEVKGKNKLLSPVLKAKTVMKCYLKSLSELLTKEISGSFLYDIKIQELFLILSECYTRRELASLLKPVLNRDFVFADFVFRNCNKVKKVRELANLSFYSETAFNRKFKVVFGITPHKWLNQRKAGIILRELKQGNKPIKQIADENEFNTLQQFNNYCLRNFNKTPGTIRKK